MRVCVRVCAQQGMRGGLRVLGGWKTASHGRALSLRATRPVLSDGSSRALADEDVHILSLRMPSILDSTEGRVTKWLKKEGESVHPGTSVCRVQLDDMEIEMESPFHGVLADIKVGEYVSVPHEEELCVMCDSQEAYMTYFERRRVATLEAGRAAAAAADMEDAKVASTSVDTGTATDGGDGMGEAVETAEVQCLRTLKRLHGEDFLEDELYARLLQLARKGDKELLIAYKASFASVEDRQEGNDTAFDAAFFIDNCKAL